MSESYHERNVNSDWNASWWYVQSGTTFDGNQDTVVADETWKWIKCSLTHDEDNHDEKDAATVRS